MEDFDEDDEREQDCGCEEIKILRRMADALRDAVCSENEEEFSKCLDLAFDILEEYDAGSPPEGSDVLN